MRKGQSSELNSTTKDGTTVNIEFPILEIDPSELKRNLKKLASKEGKEITDIEINRFISSWRWMSSTFAHFQPLTAGSL